MPTRASALTTAKLLRRLRGGPTAAVLLSLILVYNFLSTLYLLLWTPLFSQQSLLASSSPPEHGGAHPRGLFPAHMLGIDEDDNLSDSPMALFISHMGKLPPEDPDHVVRPPTWPPALELGRRAIPAPFRGEDPADGGEKDSVADRKDVVFLDGLPFEANSEEMSVTDLRVDFLDTSLCPQKEAMRRTQCPEFLRCRGKFSHVAFCRNTQWDEDGIDKVVPQNAIYRLPQPIIEFKAHLVAAGGLYISSTGHLFDRSTRYYRGGCSETERPFLMDQTSKVVMFDEVVVMLNVYSNNFFHQMIEIIPAFLQVLPLLARRPEIPILVNKELASPELLRFIGIDERKLNFVFVRRGDPAFYFGRTVYFPLFPPCHYSTRNLWSFIRHQFFTTTGPLVLGGRPLPARPSAGRNGKDFVLIMVDRSNQAERALVGQAELTELIRRELGPRELLVYTRESLPRAVETFQRAHILLGVHGAGLSNMVFMKAGSVVVEIQPEGYTNYCFYLLARTLGLPHLIVQGGGHKASQTTVDHAEVVAALRKAVRLLPAAEDQ